MIYPVSKKKSKKVKETRNIEKNDSKQKQPGFYLLESGIIPLTTDFDKEKLTPVVSQIIEYNLMPEELRPEFITLIINSPGGRIDSCLMLLDAMLSSEIPVNTLASGMAASCGMLTLMAGKVRRASSTCQIMSHQYAAGSSGKEHELYGRMKSFEQVSAWMENHYQRFTGLSLKKIRKHLLSPTDVWLTPQEAKDFNIIDEVVEF